MKLESFNKHEGDFTKMARAISDEIMDAFTEAGVDYNTAEHVIANIEEELQIGEKRALSSACIERAMPIVIDIPIEQYNEIVYNDVDKLREIIKNGTPLPKGHGKLIDSNILKRHIDKLPCLPDGNFAGNHSALKALINMQPTIIEADKAESEK